MISLEEILRRLSSVKERLRADFGVKKIGVFGSWARGEQNTDSDVDILVDFERPIGWEVVDLKELLEELLETSVDLVTYSALRNKPKLLEIVEKELANA